MAAVEKSKEESFTGQKLQENTPHVYDNFKTTSKGTSISDVEVQDNWIELDLDSNDFGKFADTSPAYCRIGEEVIEGETWGDVLAAVAEREIEKNNPVIESLRKEPLLPRSGPFLKQSSMHTGRRLSNGYWIDLSYDIPSIVKELSLLCLYCGYKEDQIQIYGVKEENYSATVQTSIDNADTAPKKAPAADVKVLPNWIKLDFRNFKSFRAATPAYCLIGDGVVEGQTWEDILVGIANREIEKRNPAIIKLCNSKSYKASLPFLTQNKIRNARLLSNGYWIYTKYGVPGLVKLISSLCSYCGYQKDQILIYGVKKEESTSDAASQTTAADKAISAKKEESVSVAVLPSHENDAAPKENSVPHVKVQEDWIKLGFSNFKSFIATNPAYCCIGDEVIEGKTWVDILVGITNIEIEKNNPALKVLYSEPLLQKYYLPFLMKNRINGVSCRQLSNGYWIDVSHNIPYIMEQISVLCLFCGYSKEQIQVYGVKGEEEIFSAARPSSVSVNTAVKKSPMLDVKVQEDWIKYAFNNSRSFEGTIPVYCSVGDEVIEGKTWEDILAAVADREIEKNNPAVKRLCNSKAYLKTTSLPIFSRDKIRSGRRLTNGYWVYTNYAVPRLIKLIGSFCLYCGYKKDQIRIFGVKKEERLSAAVLKNPAADKGVFALKKGNASSIVRPSPDNTDTSKANPILDVKVQENWIQLGPDNFESFEGTIPAYCRIEGELIEGKTWEDILVAVANKEIERNRPAIEALYHEVHMGEQGLPFLMKIKMDGASWRPLIKKYWIFLKYSTPQLVKLISSLCLYCGHKQEQIQIYGVNKDGDLSAAVSQVAAEENGVFAEKEKSVSVVVPENASDKVISINKEGNSIIVEQSSNDNANTALKKKPVPGVEVQDNWIELRSENFKSFEDTSPAYCRVGEEVIEAKTWEDVLVEIANREIEKENPALGALYHESLGQNKNLPFLMKSEIYWMKCRQLVNKHWISVDYNVPSLVRTVFNLCSRCGYGEEQIRIYGVKNGDKASIVVPKPTPADKDISVKKEESKSAAVPHAAGDNDSVVKEGENISVAEHQNAESEKERAVKKEQSSSAAVQHSNTGSDAALKDNSASAVKVQDNWIKFNLDNDDFKEFVSTFPVYCRIGDNEAIKGKNWRDILVGITNRELEKNNPAIQDLYSTPLLSRDEPFLMLNKLSDAECRRLSNGYWVNVHYNIPTLMKLISLLCKHCMYVKEQVQIYGVKKAKNTFVENKMRAIDRYTNFGIKSDWVRKYFAAKDEFWTSEHGLGSKMVEVFRRFLNDCEITIKGNFAPFGEVIDKIGLENSKAWALMLCNLVYTSEFNWWVKNIKVGTTYTAETIESMLPENLSDETKSHIISAYKNIFTFNPSFIELGLGKADCEEKNGKFYLRNITRGAWLNPEPLVILYSLYKFAESCDGCYRFTLTNLLDQNIESSGVSPTVIFGIGRDALVKILRVLSIKYPEFINESFMQGQDDITLNNKKTASDVLTLFETAKESDKSSSNEPSAGKEDKARKETKNVELEQRCAFILKKYFGNEGYQLDNSVGPETFKFYYSKEYHQDLKGSDFHIKTLLLEVGSERNGKVFPKLDPSAPPFNGIIGDISKAFDDGAGAIYVSALFEKHKDALNRINIYSVDSFIPVLEELCSDRFIFFSEKRDIVITKGERWNAYDDVLCLIKEEYSPITVKQVHERLWYVPEEKIRRILSGNSDVVYISNDAYLYTSNFPMSDENRGLLKEIVDNELNTRGSITFNELLKLIKDSYPEMLYDVEDYPYVGLKNCFKYILKNDFSVKSVIRKKGQTPVSYVDALKNFVKKYSELAYDEVKVFSLKRLNSPINWKALLGEMVRVSQSLLVNKSQMHFDVEKIDSILDNMCAGEYILLKDVSGYLSFPGVGYPWNEYLLESYLYSYSEKFSLINSSFSDYSVNGAMVRRSSKIKDYFSLAADILSYSNALNSEDEALSYLVEVGCQKRKTNKDISRIIEEALALKRRRENMRV